jgi:hypothetical protein
MYVGLALGTYGDTHSRKPKLRDSGWPSELKVVMWSMGVVAVRS